jgi:hypothetical protein
MALRILFLVMWLVHLGGCVLAYKTDSVVSTLNRSLGSFDQSFGILDADFREKSSLFERTLSDGGDRNVPPYRGLNQSLQKMKALHSSIAQQRNSFIQDKISLEEKISGRDRIRSNDPAYEQLKSIEKKWRMSFKTIERDMKSYETASREFVNRAEKSGFRKVDTASLQKQASRLEQDYSSLLNQIQSGLEKIRLQINSPMDANLNPQVANNNFHNTAIMKQAQSVFDSIKRQEPDVRHALSNLITSLEPGQVFLAGPNSKSHSELTRLESVVRQINQKTSEIQNLVSQLKR